MIATMKNDQDARYSVVELCLALGVSRSGFYDHEQKPVFECRREDDVLAQKISLLFLEGRCIYGWRRIQKGLLREGIACGKKRIVRLMKDQELAVIQKRAFRPKTKRSQSRPRGLMRCGVQILLISLPNRKAGSIWPGNWICVPGD